MSTIVAEAAARAPTEPGCYFMMGDGRELLYVGKANNVRRRLRDHARAPVDEAYVRLRSMYELVREVEWVVTASEADALGMEADLLVALQPRFNAALIDGGRWIFITTVAEGDRVVRFEIDGVPRGGRGRRPYGCFAHLGVGLASRPGIACTEGLAALYRVLWSSTEQVANTRMPASITGPSAPQEFATSVDPLLSPLLHAFLAGRSPALLDSLEASVRREEVPPFMRPALARDLTKARGFFDYGPRALRATRLRHGLPARPISRETLTAVWTSQLREAIGDFFVSPRDPAPAPGLRHTRSGWIP